jgi:diguanylate cyclase (GGDEF)-like protein
MPLRFWNRPDPALAAAGLEGEWLVARVRSVVMALLMITPTWKIAFHSENPVFRWGFAITLTASLMALAILRALQLGLWRPWFGFLSSALDVTLVTAALLTFIFVGGPLEALNSKVTYEIYFLAILATSLRYDPRICAIVGALAIVQYGLLWFVAAMKFDLHDPAYAALAGSYSTVDQITRLILLASAVLLSLAVVGRARRLLYLAIHDRLTGLYNRGQFDIAFAQEVARAERYGHPLAVAIIDLDHFKDVNDTYGHAAGDRVLVEVAARLTTSVRSTDVVARYGGEEFTLVFIGSGRSDALARLDVLRRQMVASPVRMPNGRGLFITFSAGLASAPDDGLTASALLGEADARLLAAKHAGRNRVVSAAAA